MVGIYNIEASKDADVIYIWIPADKVPFIEEQLISQEIALLARITYFGDDIPTLLQHALPQILWCGERIPQSMCLELLKKART